MPTTSEIELIRRTKGLAQELSDFLTAREETGPSMLSSAEGGIRHGTEMQTDYAARFAGRAMALAEAFGTLGITAAAGMKGDYEHPTNALGVRAVMTALGYMAEKLELRG